MLENKQLENNWCEPTHMSRFIASWKNSGGRCFYDGLFEDWLKSLGIDDRTIRDTVEMATCGKLELEKNAMRFIEEHKYDADLYC